MNILFVCTGNICRSPAAEFMLRDALAHAEDSSGAIISSAGTTGMTGYGMDPRSLAYLGAREIDGAGFTARRVNRKILKSADLVIGLDQSHVDACLTIDPSALSRAFRLHQLAEWHRSGNLHAVSELPTVRRPLPPVTGDHPDPIGFTSTEDYTRALDGIAADVREVTALLVPVTAQK
ncbi:arsenate reductase/protein-tyrosine-phosphatase family protein [Corynebacterium variabile]|uniref:arsenate reductase/protein-tyrosine-phosphatase family protein n=1 Tax=Corynebacterium variabile TaxID=1727 RepID=UPI003FD3EF7C